MEQILLTLLQTVPIWTFVILGIKYWIDKSLESSAKFKESLDARFQTLQIDQQKLLESIRGMEEGIHTIQLHLASSNLSTLRDELEDLRDHTLRNEMKLESTVKRLDEIRAVHRK